MKERVLKKGMSINCRTEEEREVFIEFAHKEGHRWANDDSLLLYKGDYAPCSFQVEYEFRKFPKSISQASVDWNGYDEIPVTQVEASELFHNQIISRRIKNGLS